MQKRLALLDVFLVLQLLVIAALGANIAIAAGLFGEGESEFEGLKITLLTTPECPTCFSLQPLRDYLAQNGVEDSQISEVTFDSRPGRRLVSKYDITQVPTAVITGPYGDYEFMAGLADSIAEARNKALVITKVQPPYIDLSDNNKVRGEFEAVYVTDDTCAECYDVSLHEGVLERMAMTATKTTSVDIGSDEGKTLVEEYVLTAVPTVLLRGDLEPYDQLQEIWSLVGTIEEDGTYVLRQGVSSMGTYKRLPEGEIVKEETQS